MDVSFTTVLILFIFGNVQATLGTPKSKQYETHTLNNYLFQLQWQVLC